MTAPQPFAVRARAYADFVAEHGRHPGHHAPDRVERSLAGWLRDARRGTARLTDDQVALLDRVVPGWQDLTPTGARRIRQPFEERVRAYADFVTMHGRPPSTDTDDRTEHSLATWLVNVRGGAIALTDDRVALLTDIIPGWRSKSRPVTFAARARAYADFVTAHGHHPDRNSGDPDEQGLARWLRYQRRTQDRLTVDQVALLDRVLPGWRDPRYGSIRWREFAGRARAYADFVTAHGRQPSPQSGDPDERSLVHWLRYQRRTQDRLTVDQVALLNRVLPGWRELQRPQTRRLPFAVRARACADFVTTHGHQPSPQSGDPDERSLARWVRHVRRTEDRRTADQVALLDRALPGWRDPQHDSIRRRAFEGRARAYADFVAAQAHRPSQHAGDPIERSLATWLTYVCRTEDRRTPDQVALLDEVLPGWRGRVTTR